jgi:hypothetical protein
MGESGASLAQSAWRACQLRHAHLSSKTVEEQRAAIQEAARVAFRCEASDKAANLGLVLREAAKYFRRSMWSRLIEHAVTASIASSLTASLVYVILK